MLRISTAWSKKSIFGNKIIRKLIFSRCECKIIRRSTNQLELGLFENLIHIQLDGKAIGRVVTWSNISDANDDTIECKITYSTEGKLSQNIMYNFQILFSY